tara:strand:+ start:432 stop:809 length:378 start_codon:yes stop_codon:yes gene_type:complete
MGVPDWNKTEQTVQVENTQAYVPEFEVDYSMNSEIRIETNHSGTASYSERGITRYTIGDIVNDGIASGHWRQEQIDAGNIPSLDDITEWAREFHYEHGEIDEYDDIEYDNYDQHDWEIQDISIRN